MWTVSESYFRTRRRRSRPPLTNHTPPTDNSSGPRPIIRKCSRKQPGSSESQSLAGLISPAAVQAKDTWSHEALILAELWVKRTIRSLSEMLSLLLLRYFIETETLAVSGAINSSPLVTSPTSPEKHKVFNYCNSKEFLQAWTDRQRY